MINFVLKNSPRYMRFCVLRDGHARSYEHDMAWRHVLPRYIHYRNPVLPGTTDQAISEQSPGSPEISGHSTDIYSSSRIYLCYLY
eukprot:1352219-Amorphochlora_amoeboformis.AAC.1